jgi:hypothetical protein
VEIAVLLEPVPGKGYRARGGEPFAFEAEGSTKEEALTKLRKLIASRIEEGAEIMSVEISSGENPWISFAGMFRDDPLFDRWQAVIAENRKESK